MLARGQRARPVSMQIVGVRSVHHAAESTSPRKRHHARPELRLAVVAAVRRIRRVARVVQLVGVYLGERQVQERGEVARRTPLTLGIGLAAAHDGDHARRAEHGQRHGG